MSHQVRCDCSTILHAAAIETSDFGETGASATGETRKTRVADAPGSPDQNSSICEEVIMVIELEPALESALNDQAQKQGIAPELLALNALRLRLS